MSLEPKKKLPNKKILKSAKFEAKEQFTQSALENLTKENDLLIKNLKKAGEINEEAAQLLYVKKSEKKSLFNKKFIFQFNNY